MDATNMENLQITPLAVKQRLDRGEQFLLVDVREPKEFAICRIAGAKLIPLGSIPSNFGEIEASDDVVLYCHHGLRSLDAAMWLRQKGVDNARSMSGGIERWSAEIDAKVSRY